MGTIEQRSPGMEARMARFLPDNMTPSHKRGPWSSQEDTLLMSLVDSHGPYNWVHIAQTLKTRTPKQCRERYHQNLKPTLNHNPITPDEGAEIERLVGQLGKRWAEIARRLNNRSDNAVKNWWNGNQNRRKRRIGELDEAEVHHEHRWYMAGPGSQSSPTMTTTTDPIRPPSLALPLPVMSSSNYGYTHSQRHHGPWIERIEPPLPSPCSSESAKSDFGSNYTMSPTYNSLPPPTVELPPVRLWGPVNPPERNKLPSFNSFAPPENIINHTPQLPLPSFAPERRDSFISGGELPTAPNSPQYAGGTRESSISGPIIVDDDKESPIQDKPKDPRLSVASLLSPAGEMG